MPASFSRPIGERMARGDTVFTWAWGSTGWITLLVLSRQRERTIKSLPVPLSLEKGPTGPCPSDRCCRISQWNSFMCSLGAFQIAAFVLVSRVTKSACEPFKRSISVSYSPLGLLDVSPVGVQSQMFWGFISLLQFPRIGVLDVGYEPLSPQEKKLHLWDSSWLWVPVPGVGFWGDCILLLLPSLMWPFYHLLQNVQLVFRSFPEGIVQFVAVDLCVHWVWV